MPLLYNIDAINLSYSIDLVCVFATFQDLKKSKLNYRSNCIN